MAANYIMKCDDDTFIRVDAVMKEARKVREDKSLYIGNMNYYHRPLRHGKWAVTYEVLILVKFCKFEMFHFLNLLFLALYSFHFCALT